ncbi:MAG: hypothetical protein MJH11_19655 [Lentisphaeria bacterium]|nr:hypothetical protein [Lentisphaeria bacterium]
MPPSSPGSISQRSVYTVVRFDGLNEINPCVVNDNIMVQEDDFTHAPFTGSTDAVIPCSSQTAKGILVVDADVFDFGVTLCEFFQGINFGIG